MQNISTTINLSFQAVAGQAYYFRDWICDNTYDTSPILFPQSLWNLFCSSWNYRLLQNCICSFLIISCLDSNSSMAKLSRGKFVADEGIPWVMKWQGLNPRDKVMGFSIFLCFFPYLSVIPDSWIWPLNWQLSNKHLCLVTWVHWGFKLRDTRIFSAHMRSPSLSASHERI